MAEWQILTLCIVLGYPLLWVAIMAGVVWLGPWSRLVAKYPLNELNRPLLRARMVSMHCCYTSYGNCLTLDLDDHQLTVRAMPGLFFHPPWTVPKSAIRQLTTGQFWGWNWIQFWVDDAKFLLWGPWARPEILQLLQ